MNLKCDTYFATFPNGKVVKFSILKENIVKLLCPEGTSELSPVIYRWVSDVPKNSTSPVGMAEYDGSVSAE